LGEKVTRILLVDDEDSVRKGLRMYFELLPELDVVGEARSGKEAMKKAQALDPDVVVMDVELEGTDGITATKEILEANPSIAVVMHSVYGDPATQAKALDAGAKAFVEKDAEIEILLEEIRRVLKNKLNQEK
jgi:DNA-binding NarL/FixJ family response regulator